MYLVAGVDEAGGGDDGAGEEGDGRDGGSQLLEDDRGLARARPGSPEALGNEQTGEAELLGERAPQAGDVGVGLVGQTGGQRVVERSLERRADARAQGLLDVGVEKVDQRGTSLKAIPLSGRWSGGRPSTRSAMTLRMISLVPPSIELPLARR